MTIRLVEQEAPEPCTELAEWAEDIAKQARAGEVVSIVFAVVRLDGSWGTGTRGSTQSICETVGRIESLKMDLINSGKVI